MSLKLTPTSFVAGVMTEIFAYDFDHDNDDLSTYDKAMFVFTPSDGSPVIPWPVDHIEKVRGYSCDSDPAMKDKGKVVGLLIYTTPIAPPRGCASFLARLIHALLGLFQPGRVRGTSTIGSGDLGGSTSSSGQPTIAFASTPVQVSY